ncbi:hypothetical protein A6M27_06475 [Acidithiobacillus thiooxidans]|uniref:Uncharacterized protein n=1 Tax=Acidithiobacillus thiooxidans TaxID=930 RepID=A0A1C2IAB6_ACITH|nr:hypothetical protein [Acidithiobacillus thiooxidans]OCX67800.1 hypothetical protein A6O24_20525 [Acidithiobacillus thiooxidans]OCX72932.1 hypothetical protein A6P07_09160 [Acidithiobacillus thiooxidans]OCX88639.1 hypothetical protein A6M27_06475 [Acidithiobacillus thiooxidans]OFC50338.1 hypothetical protein BAE47_03295 [Acidithiobacillus thiooxidans]
MEIYDRQFPPYQHHCLTGRRLAHGDLDPYCKTPYQRGWFLAVERYHYQPTKLDLEIFEESGEFDRAMTEFNLGAAEGEAEGLRRSRLPPKFDFGQFVLVKLQRPVF